jgi:hypothetical protein
VEEDRGHRCRDMTWRVCPHIYRGDYLSARYKDLGTVTFVYGTVLCDDCRRLWEANRTLDLLDRCQPMCDSCLIAFVINELCLINGQVLTARRKSFHEVPEE